MKFFTASLLVLVLTACTSLQPVQLAPSDIHHKITKNELIEVGETVEIITKDGHFHEIQVDEITDTHLITHPYFIFDKKIKTTDIIALEKYELSTWKTTTLISIFLLPVLLIPPVY